MTRTSRTGWPARIKQIARARTIDIIVALCCHRSEYIPAFLAPCPSRRRLSVSLPSESL